MTVEHVGIELAPDEGKKVSAMGVDMVFKAVSEETGGACFCMEYPHPRDGPDRPSTSTARPTKCSTSWKGRSPCSWTSARSGAHPAPSSRYRGARAHTFANFGAGPAKYLIRIIPGGFEGYFEDLPRVVDEHGYPPPPEVMEQLGLKYDFQNVGPRPTPPDAE